MTLIPSLTFTDYEWFPWSICNGCGMPAGNAYPSGHLVPSPILGLANAPIVETKFLELAVSLLDFSPRIPLGTFSILLVIESQTRCPQVALPQIYAFLRMALVAEINTCISMELKCGTSKSTSQPGQYQTDVTLKNLKN